MDTAIIEDTLKQTIRGVDKGDLVASCSGGWNVEFEFDRLKSVENQKRFSIGLRLFENGRIGNSFINSLEDTDSLIANAKQSVELGDEMDFELPTSAEFPQLKLYYPEVENYKKEKAIEIGKDAVQRLKALDERVQVDTVIGASSYRSYLTNSNGYFHHYDESRLNFSANVVLVEDNGSLLYVGDGDSAYDSELEWERVFSNIEWRFKHALKKASVNSGYMPVILAPEAVSLLLNTIEIAANGRSRFKGLSVLDGKIGEQIADSKMSIHDDPFYPRGLGSYPFDDEGIVPKPIPIIEEGRFANFIYDLETAKRMNTESTGHASRSTGSLPKPSYSNLIFSRGDATREQLIRDTDYGLLVFEALGGGMSNVIAGDFSVNVELGYLIEGGEVKGRVKDVMLAGNVFDLLKDIRAMGKDLRRMGDTFVPDILLNKVSVSA